MNFLRKLIRASPTDEVASIPFGKFFLTRSFSSPKGALECLYNDSSLTIKQTTKPHCYQLSVTRAYQEGESSSHSGDEEEDEDDEQSSSKDFSSNDERLFFINQDLCPMLYTKNDGTQAISWKDINGDEGERLEFVVDEDVRANEATKFMLTLFRCLYEDKYGMSSAAVSEADLKSEFERNIKWEQQTAAGPMSLLKSMDVLSSNLRNVALDDDHGTESEMSSSETFKDASSIPYHILQSVSPNGKIMHTFDAELRVYDPCSDHFCLLVSRSEFAIVKNGPAKYTLTGLGPNKSVSSPISKAMSPSIRRDALSFIFTHKVKGPEKSSDRNKSTNERESSEYSLLLRFESQEELAQFEIALSKALDKVATNSK